MDIGLATFLLLISLRKRIKSLSMNPTSRQVVLSYWNPIFRFSYGELIIGVDDSSLNVYGIRDVRSVFEQKITETIINNIEPKPIVDIVF